ncbi:MAG TPA: diguanylate cyclase, partial [Luteimonas sp.]|nr:diguanylate cyclase [Luteimonas sp.]
VAEARNLVIDAVFGGMWIAAVGFSLVPSALIVSTLAVDRISVGGWRLLRRCLLFMALAMALVSALCGFPLALQSSMTVVLWSLPLILLYPIATSTASFQLARRVRKQNRQLERLNRIDLLTGLRNRRHLEEVAGAELARHLRARRPAVLLLIDIDGFKQVNDRHGHLAGDGVLRCVAKALRTSIREIDTAARYGGDEFAVLLTETDRRAAMLVAERIRTTFLDMRSEAVAALGCTLSIGLAEADRSLTSTDDWVRRADASMYQAKGSGGNRVETAVATG